MHHANLNGADRLFRPSVHWRARIEWGDRQIAFDQINVHALAPRRKEQIHIEPRRAAPCRAAPGRLSRIRLLTWRGEPILNT